MWGSPYFVLPGRKIFLEIRYALRADGAIEKDTVLKKETPPDGGVSSLVISYNWDEKETTFLRA